MLSYALTQAPYGGVPADEIYPRYGIGADEFGERIAALLCAADPNIAAREREYLIRVAA